MRDRRSLLLVVILSLGATGLCVCCGVPTALYWAIPSKPDEPAWERCGVGERSVRGIAIAPDGRLWAATEGAGAGDVYESRDACTTAQPLGLDTDVVWGVDWMARTGELCASARGALYCGPPGALTRYPLMPGDDVYWVVDPLDASSPDRLLTGGFPTVSARSGGQLVEVERLGYASSAAVVTSWGTLVGGRTLRVSTDGGRSFTDVVPGVSDPVHALVARGDVVYAAGGFADPLLARSADGGRTWTELDSPGAQPESLLMPSEDPDIVVLGTHGLLGPGDAWLSRDGGLEWTALGCPGAEIHALAADSQYLYCGATALRGASGMWRIPLSHLGIDR